MLRPGSGMKERHRKAAAMHETTRSRPSPADSLLSKPPSASGPIRISLDAVRESRRPDVHRAASGRFSSRVGIDPVRDIPSMIDATMQGRPGVNLLAGRPAGACNPQPCAANVGAGDDFVLVVNLTGGDVAIERDRELVLGDGEATLMSCSDPFDLVYGPPGDVLAIRVLRRRLAPLVKGIDDCVMRPIPRHTMGLTMLRDYIGMAGDRTIVAPELRELAVGHIHDLVAVALSATRDNTEPQPGRGPRAVRLSAIKQDIHRNLAHGDLSVGALALRHGCTPRFVQRLFEQEGTTFTDYVLAQRLASAHGMLNDPARAAEKISAIAYEVGFSDLSYFNRVFRRRYGVAPSDIRAKVRQETAGMLAAPELSATLSLAVAMSGAVSRFPP
jgi:AraC-like DNA-binding protein